jgi:hypothetical protein
LNGEVTRTGQNFRAESLNIWIRIAVPKFGEKGEKYEL